MPKKYLLNNCIIDLEQDLVVNSSDSREYLKKNQRILMSLLIKNYPNFASIDEIKLKVWGHTFISNESVTQLVKQTRTVINDENKAIIVNQKGKGYALSNYEKYSEHQAELESVDLNNATDIKSGRSNITKPGIMPKDKLVKTYLIVSLIFWFLATSLFIYHQDKQLSLNNIPEFNKSNIIISDSTKTTISISDGHITCHLDSVKKEGFCENNK